MNITGFIKEIGIPLISVGTAVMVGLLNFKVSQNDQELKERISALDLLVTKAKEERAERESNQNFNIKIYDIVTESLEEANPKKQQAASALVVVMVEEPLRSSLLNVLWQGGNPEVKANIGKVLEQEGKFQSNVATIPAVSRSDTSTYAWEDWDLDIFWCASSGQSAEKQAELIGEQLVAEGAKGRIRIRELPDSINAKAGFQIQGYAIRINESEQSIGNALKKLAENSLEKNGIRSEFNIGLSRQNTDWYVSAFVCPLQRG